MWLKAMLRVERHPSVRSGKAAIAGFLRENGTSVCKDAACLFDRVTIYKAVHLHLPALLRLGVRYQRSLQMFEDVCIVNEVVSKGGGTLKIMDYAFFASHSTQGGANAARSLQASGISLPALVGRFAHHKQPQSILNILKWATAKERAAKRHQLNPTIGITLGCA